MIYDMTRLESFATRIYCRYNYLDKYTLEKIGKSIKKYGRLTSTEARQLKNIAKNQALKEELIDREVNKGMNSITAELARITKLNIQDIETSYTQAVSDGVENYKPMHEYANLEFVPFSENQRAKAIVKHWATETSGEMINLSRTKAIGFVDGGNFTPLNDLFYTAIDDAVIATTTGTIPFNEALAKTLQRFGDCNIMVNYGSGVHRSLGAVTRQNMLHGMKRAGQEYDRYIGEYLGCDGFEVDAHAGARPSHLFMQGQMYAYGSAVTIDGEHFENGDEALDALDDYGCLHYKTDVFLGISKSRYTQKELDDIEKASTEQIEYNGQSKTLYEWKQTQRRYERNIRNKRNEAALLNSAGLTNAAKEKREQINEYKTKYNDMTKSIKGLYDHSDRFNYLRG